MRLVLVCLGGALGTGLRYAAGVLAVRWLGADFPWGTLAVNLAGSFLIGLVQQVALSSAAVPDTARLFLTVGVMGGLTTYSSWSYETMRLLERGAWLHAGANVLGTAAGCLMLCALGMATGRWLAALR